MAWEQDKNGDGKIARDEVAGLRANVFPQLDRDNNGVLE